MELTEIRKSANLFQIDFCKAVAIIFVLIFHFLVAYDNNVLRILTIKTSYSDIIITLYKTVRGILGVYGVSFFLVLSGLGLSLSKNTFNTLNAPKSWYVKRFLKIYPSYWCVWGGQIFVNFLLKGTCLPASFYLLSFFGVQSLISSYFLELNGSWWFVALIIQLYLVFPLLRYLLNRFGNRKFLIGVLVLTIASRCFGLSDWGRSIHFTGVIFTSRLFEFGFGMAFATFCDKNALKWSSKLFFGFIVISAVFAVLNYFLIPHAILHDFSAISLFMACYILSSHLSRESLLKTAVVFISSISYEIFLINWPVIDCVKIFGPKNMLPALIFVLGSVIVFGWILLRVSSQLRNVMVRSLAWGSYF